MTTPSASPTPTSLTEVLVQTTGLENLKDIKNQDVVLQIKNMMFKQTTGHDGVLDMIFRCETKWQTEQVSLRTGKFESVQTLNEAIGKIRIPDKKCK